MAFERAGILFNVDCILKLLYLFASISFNLSRYTRSTTIIQVAINICNRLGKSFIDGEIWYTMHQMIDGYIY